MEKSRVRRKDMDYRNYNLYNEMTAMKKRMILATLSSLLLCMADCSNKQLPTSEDILTEARAVKTLNAYDEMNCVVYDMNSCLA